MTTKIKNTKQKLATAAARNSTNKTKYNLKHKYDKEVPCWTDRQPSTTDRINSQLARQIDAAFMGDVITAVRITCTVSPLISSHSPLICMRMIYQPIQKLAYIHLYTQMYV